MIQFLSKAFPATMVLALASACSKQGSVPAPAVHTLAIDGTDLVVDAPSGIDGRSVANDHGYVDYLVGRAGHDPCTVGIEVYLAAAPDRPRTLEDLRKSADNDHQASYTLTAPAEIVQRAGRPTVTATLTQLHPVAMKQRQWGFLLDADPIIVTAYSPRELTDCVALEEQVIGSLRRSGGAR